MRKKSYTLFCSSAFRDQVEALAKERLCTPADLARAALLALPPDVIQKMPDPGEPEAGDRESVTLKSGPSKGRTLRRKPRLQIRLPGDFPPDQIRRALAMLLARQKHASGGQDEDVKKLRHELARLKEIVEALSFTPLNREVTTREEALYIMGFGTHERPRADVIRQRFKLLALIYHPDSAYAGHHQRMAELNAAYKFLLASPLF